MWPHRFVNCTWPEADARGPPPGVNHFPVPLTATSFAEVPPGRHLSPTTPMSIDRFTWSGMVQSEQVSLASSCSAACSQHWLSVQRTKQVKLAWPCRSVRQSSLHKAYSSHTSSHGWPSRWLAIANVQWRGLCPARARPAPHAAYMGATTSSQSCCCLVANTFCLWHHLMAAFKASIAPPSMPDFRHMMS